MRSMKGMSREELVETFPTATLISTLNEVRKKRGLEQLSDFKGKKDVASKLYSLLLIKDVSVGGDHDGPYAEPGKDPEIKTRSGVVKFKDSWIIEVVSLRSPKRMTKRNPYAHYRTGRTVAETLATGHVSRRDLNWDEKCGYIKIYDPLARRNEAAE